MQRLSFAGANIPKQKFELKFKDSSAQVQGVFNIKQRGCYEVGLYSKTRTFAGFLGESPNYKGDYTLTYSYNNQTSQKNMTISKDSKRTGYTGVGGKTVHSTLMLDIVEIKNRHINSSLNINFELKDADPILKNDKLYFFARQAGDYCGEKKMLRDSRDIRNPINNETLIPLYNAIKNHNLTAVEEFFKETKLPYNVTMSGNRTALHYATYFGDAKIVDYLLKKDRSMI